MAQKDLIPFNKLTEEKQKELAKKGGKASGEARRKKKAMRETLEMLLDEKYKKTGRTYREEATIGLLKGAIYGNAQNYKTILETLGELKLAEENKMNNELSKVEELLAKIKEEANNDTK